MDARADDRAAGSDRGQSGGDQLAGRGEDDRCVERFRPRLEGVARPLRAELPSEALRRLVLPSREGEHTAPLVAGHLGHDVRRRAEAVETHARRVTGEAKRAIADQAGAQQRGSLEVGVPVGQWQAGFRVRQCTLGVAAVHRVAGEQRPPAEVLAACRAVLAAPARPRQPGHADAVTRDGQLHARPGLLDGTHDLVPEDEGELRLRELAVCDMEVGAAQPAGGHRDADLAGAWLRGLAIDQTQGALNLLEEHGSHAVIIAPVAVESRCGDVFITPPWRSSILLLSTCPSSPRRLQYPLPAAMRILLADDEPRLLHIVSMYLGMEGYDVRAVSDGEEALRVVESEMFDLAVLDVMMPGVDGIEVCRRIRANEATKSLPVLMFTSLSADADVEKARLAGANHMITKPFSLPGLGAVIKSVFERASALAR